MLSSNAPLSLTVPQFANLASAYNVGIVWKATEFHLVTAPPIRVHVAAATCTLDLIPPISLLDGLLPEGQSLIYCFLTNSSQTGSTLGFMLERATLPKM